MAMLNFDATQIDPSQPVYEAVPSGEYKVAVTASDMKTSQSGGQYLELQLTILEGEYQGRVVVDRLNLVNRNPQAQNIAQRQFSALCHAVNKLQVQDSQQLHNLPCFAVVEAKAGSYVNKDGLTVETINNNVKGYKAIAQQTAQPRQTAAPANNGGWNQGGSNPFGATNGAQPA